MKEFDELVRVVRKLRKKCPWDRKQTTKSLKPYMLEEVNEAIEAIDQNNHEKLAEELGDQLLHIVMHAEISKKFTIKDIIKHITAKMIRRHPHVFHKVKVKNVAEVLKNWNELKQAECKTAKTGVKLKKMQFKHLKKNWKR